MLNNYFELFFEVIKRADNSRYANWDDIRLVNLGPIALFSKPKVTTSSGKHLLELSHSHKVSLLYKLKTSAKYSDDLSIGFDGSHVRRRQVFTDYKNKKGKFHVRIMLKDIFGFAEHQEKSTYGLGYKSTPTRNKDDSVFKKLWQ